MSEKWMNFNLNVSEHTGNYAEYLHHKVLLRLSPPQNPQIFSIRYDQTGAMDQDPTNLNLVFFKHVDLELAFDVALAF